MRKPRPIPKKIPPATERMDATQLYALAEQVAYIGSSHHKDVPSMGLVPAPRQGAMSIEKAEAQGISNPDCTLCPRKWAGRGEAATELLRTGIRSGQISLDATAEMLSSQVWVRDPDENIVYEAKRLTYPTNGYKAYPLTSRQVRALPMAVR